MLFKINFACVLDIIYRKQHYVRSCVHISLVTKIFLDVEINF